MITGIRLRKGWIYNHETKRFMPPVLPLNVNTPPEGKRISKAYIDEEGELKIEYEENDT